MTQRRLRERRDFNHSKQKIIVKMLHWTLMSLMVSQQLKTTAAVKFKGDNCFTKNKSGVCKGWSECPIIKTLIDSGEYTNREVVSCGFGVKEELICCPVGTNTKTENSTPEYEDRSSDRFTTTTTSTTEKPVKDFWLDLLTNTSSTTAKPDFWLDLIKPTTTTTLKPLIFGDQKLNESSEFYDLNALLGQNQNKGNQYQRTTTPVKEPFNQPGLPANGNVRGNNLSTGPANVNQWGSSGSTASNFNKKPGVASFNNGATQFVGNGNGNGNGHFDWSQQNNGRGGKMNGNLNSNRGHIMGRGPDNHNSNGHAHFNGPHDNGRFHNNWGWENQQQSIAFPQNNVRPNQPLSGEPNQCATHKPPGGPVNNMQEQNSNLPVFQKVNKPNIEPINNNNKNNDKIVEDLIKNIFDTSEFGLEDSNDVVNANIYNLNKPTHHFINIPQNADHPQPVVWLTPHSNNNNHKTEFVQFPTMNQQQKFMNPQVSRHFEVIPAAGNQLNGNDLEEAPSTNFIQQPVAVQTWPTPDVDPVNLVYNNLVHSGMNIVKAQENPLSIDFNSQPSQVTVMQPSRPAQQFIQLLQKESADKGTRSAISMHQFVQQPETIPILNVQSPPRQVLSPFKPSEFRPSTVLENNFSEDNNSLSNNPVPWTDPKTSKDRPSERACNRIRKGLSASLSQHIIGGTPAELGEFPHMVAIGYSRIGGDDKPPYDIRCGGTLIDKRFVLTAAHCVSDRESIPSIVRLGVVNFKDEKQMSAAVELRIKQTYIHDDYRTRLTYNDIAILELESDVEYNENIYPICLYTDLKDPDPKIKLWVTGWGTINTTTRSFSDILLKAPLHTAPLEHCNKSFTDYGLNRKIPEGIRLTQFCAEDKDQVKDACQGDSGGPLILIVDESYKNYRLVGVVSSGFGCASITPGLYTRVAAYLEFIEKIVWPNGGD